MVGERVGAGWSWGLWAGFGECLAAGYPARFVFCRGFGPVIGGVILRVSRDVSRDVSGVLSSAGFRCGLAADYFFGLVFFWSLVRLVCPAGISFTSVLTSGQIVRLPVGFPARSFFGPWVIGFVVGGWMGWFMGWVIRTFWPGIGGPFWPGIGAGFGWLWGAFLARKKTASRPGALLVLVGAGLPFPFRDREAFGFLEKKKFRRACGALIF